MITKFNLLLFCWQHILYAHGPWFVKDYGNLGIWNTQEIEKSHKQVRIAYHKSNQHRGGSTLSNPLVQMFQWFYRRIVSRFPQAIEFTSEDSIEEWIRDSRTRKKCEAWEQFKDINACTKLCSKISNWMKILIK